MFDHCLTPSAWWCRHPQYVWPPGRGCPAGTSGCPSCPPPCQCPRPHGRTCGRPRRKSPETRPRPRTSRHGPQGQWWIPLWFLRCRMVSTPFKGKTCGQNYQRKMRKWKGAVLSMGNLDISTPTYKYFVHSGTFDPRPSCIERKHEGWQSDGPCSNPSFAPEFACAPGRQWHTRSLQPQCPARAQYASWIVHDASCLFQMVPFNGIRIPPISGSLYHGITWSREEHLHLCLRESMLQQPLYWTPTVGLP